MLQMCPSDMHFIFAGRDGYIKKSFHFQSPAEAALLFHAPSQHNILQSICAPLHIASPLQAGREYQFNPPFHHSCLLKWGTIGRYIHWQEICTVHFQVNHA